MQGAVAAVGGASGTHAEGMPNHGLSSAGGSSVGGKVAAQQLTGASAHARMGGDAAEAAALERRRDEQCDHR